MNSNGSNVTSDDQEKVYGETVGLNMWGCGSGRVREYTHSGRLIPHGCGSSSGNERVYVIRQGSTQPIGNSQK